MIPEETSRIRRPLICHPQLSSITPVDLPYINTHIVAFCISVAGVALVNALAGDAKRKLSAFSTMP
jgi:hypothetical protein